MAKTKTIKFGSVDFKHKPLSMLALITLFDPETLLKDSLSTFADFANEANLCKTPITWQDLAKQGSLQDFRVFVADWQGLVDTGNDSSASES